jgi:hypothetical protein
MDWVLDGVFDWLARRVVELLTWLLGFMTAHFFTSPDVTVLPQVTGMVARSAVVVDAVFVAAILVAGILVMTHSGLQLQYEAKDLLPRLVVGLVASTFGLEICHGLIEVFNAITTAMVGRTSPGPRSVEYVRDVLRIGVEGTSAVRALISVDALIIVVLVLQVMLSMVMRMSTLLLLAGVAPVALACHGLPQTQQVAVVWWRALIGVLTTPVLQGIAFSVGVDLMLNPDHTLHGALGMTGMQAQAVAAMNLVLLTCLLLVTVRIPRLVARYVMAPCGSSGGIGVVIRAVLVQTLLRRIPVPGLRRLVR